MMDIDCPWAGAVVVAAAPETRELTACWTHFPLSWSGVVINPQKESFTRSFEIEETLLACSEGRLTAGLTRSPQRSFMSRLVDTGLVLWLRIECKDLKEQERVKR